MRFHWVVSLSAAAFMFASHEVRAGDGNEVFILQSSGAGLGNNLRIDQTQATNSLVAGNVDDPANARINPSNAEQLGGGNFADISLTGLEPVVLLNQNFTGTFGDPSNSAILSGGDYATIILDQNGFGNSGEISVTGQNSTGIIRQNGNNNNGFVSVLGQDATGELIQNGNGNTVPLTVEGDGVTATYTLNGNGLSVAGATPVVSATGGVVTITQTALP